MSPTVSAPAPESNATTSASTNCICPESPSPQNHPSVVPPAASAATCCRAAMVGMRPAMNTEQSALPYDRPLAAQFTPSPVVTEVSRHVPPSAASVAHDADPASVPEAVPTSSTGLPLPSL